MKPNWLILRGILMEKVASLYQKGVQELLVLNRVIPKLFSVFITFMEVGAIRVFERVINYNGGIGFIFGYAENKPLLLSRAYTRLCVKRRSKLDCFLNIAPQRMLILKPNMLCKLRA